MADHAHQQPWTRRERPWLIPSNRKLGHIHQITLRNLALSQHAGRPRRQTNDDEALPTALKTPAKMLALREGKQLGHSRSSNDLRPIHETAIDDAAKPSAVHGNGAPKDAKQKTPPRPSFAKMRRRSTMEWAGATSQQRQRKLESVSATRMADIFFSLHVSGVQDPVYVSEVVEKAMNPNFNHIDLGGCGPGITRADSLTVKFWTKTEAVSDYSLLLDMTLSLRSLQFLGKSLASFHHPFPPNCVLFQLTDGFYTCFTDAKVDEPLDPFTDMTTKASSNRILPTSSFDALLRLSKLDDSIQDALTLRERLASDLEHTLRQHKDARYEKHAVGETEDFLKTVNYATATVQKQLKALQQKRDEKRKSLQSRRQLIDQGRADQKVTLQTINSSRPELEDVRTQHQILVKAISAQRRRICTDLSAIYPIVPMPKRSLAFTIRALHLPNSEDLDSATPDVLSAALGHVSHIVQLVSFYLGVVLPYPPHPRSSTSSISDPISTLGSTNGQTTSTPSPITASSSVAVDRAARIFPLFSKGAVRFRFEYALFLLNKDIELLLSSHFGVRVLDIRQTLPNLLLTLYCATAGEGELPARKAGGVRGLMRSGRGSDGASSMPQTVDGDKHRGTSDGLAHDAVTSLVQNREAQGKVLGGVA
ncbi:hypothetical protein MBLNU459_g7323t1 [Dothideomycetes sp. NU459]